jgi:2-oxoisovalerate dehydrogenase E1 component
MNVFEFVKGFTGLEARQVDGSDFEASYQVMSAAIGDVRRERKPVVIHATVPLLGHHTSGV